MKELHKNTNERMREELVEMIISVLECNRGNYLVLLLFTDEEMNAQNH